MTLTRLTAAAVAVACPLLLAPAAMACTTHTVSNSRRSDWNIGTWTDSHCGNGHIHLIAPGHHRSGVRSIKAYGKHNVLRRPGHAAKKLIKRHCYKVTGKGWTVTSIGD